MKTDEDRRQAVRVHIELPVTMLETNGTQTLLALDISHRGMFIKTDAPAPVRRLVRLRIPWDDEGQELIAMAMVVHRVMVEEARRRNVHPGMGVQLYGLGPVARNRWNAWVDQLAARYGDRASQDKPPPVHPLAAVLKPKDAVRRAHVRYDVCWDVRVIGNDFEETRTRDVSAGGALIEVNKTYASGDDISLIIMHPDTGRGFDIGARVIRYVPPKAAGTGAIGVAFTDMDDDRVAEMKEFIESGLPEEDADVLEILENNDPMLE